MTQLSACLFIAGALTACPASRAPKAVFKPWDGTWRGRFEVKDSKGAVLTALAVRQVYRSESDDLQRGQFTERDEKTGQVTTANAINSKDGDKLKCVVEKSSGERVEHAGRWTGEAIEWSRDTKEAKELFLEKIVTSTDGATYYQITGWGEYNGGPRLHFWGRYKKQ